MLLVDWIRVTDRLPLEGVYVLVAFRSPDTFFTAELEVCEARWWTFEDGQKWQGLSFTGYSGNVEMPCHVWREVLYWSEMPPPPAYDDHMDARLR